LVVPKSIPKIFDIYTIVIARSVAFALLTKEG